MDIQASLEALCSCPGPSGREDAVASQAMELLRPLMDEVKKDRFGNVIGIRRCGTENAKRRWCWTAHLDEVGLVITGAKRRLSPLSPCWWGRPSDASQPGSHPLPAPQFGLVAVLPPHVQRQATPTGALHCRICILTPD